MACIGHLKAEKGIESGWEAAVHLSSFIIHLSFTKTLNVTDVRADLLRISFLSQLVKNVIHSFMNGWVDEWKAAKPFQGTAEVKSGIAGQHVQIASTARASDNSQ